MRKRSVHPDITFGQHIGDVLERPSCSVPYAEEIIGSDEFTQDLILDIFLDTGLLGRIRNESEVQCFPEKPAQWMVPVELRIF